MKNIQFKLIAYITDGLTHPDIIRYFMLILEACRMVREYDYEEAKANEVRLLEASTSFDDMAIVKIMKEIVPEYKSQHSKYQQLDKE